MGFSTDAIHAGQQSDLTTGAVITPIYMTSTYVQEELGVNKGFKYGRSHNLTRYALEKNIATLEKAKYGFAFSSGVSAIHAIMSVLKPGDHVIATENLYGGSYRLFEKVFKEYKIEFSWVNNFADNILKFINPKTKMVFIETPTNPLLHITDLKKVVKICKEHNLISVVDNTFMTPYFQKPIELGIDVVVHSSTKYLNGHSDIIGGIVLTNSDTISQKLKFIQNAIGAVPSPFDCWLILRSTKTLAVRMRQHNENALKIAQYLEKSDKIKKVYYPGLTSHPQHKLVKKQMTGFSGMLAIEFGDEKIAKKFLKSTKIFKLAESLGGVESLMSHPASMSHAALPQEKKDAFGITNSLVRISVGIEDVEDLISDIEQALDK